MDLTQVAFNTADVMAVGVLVLGATVVLWGIKKLSGWLNNPFFKRGILLNFSFFSFLLKKG